MTDQTISEAARALAAQRPRAIYTCVVCGAEFEAVEAAGARIPATCSPACRQKRWRQQKARKED